MDKITDNTHSDGSYRKKSVVIAAIQLDSSPQSLHDVLDFIGSTKPYVVYDEENEKHTVIIPTLEGGGMRVFCGDWVIRDAEGNINCCKPDIFSKTYEPAALAAGARQPDAPSGWKLVPIDPTHEMLKAGDATAKMDPTGAWVVYPNHCWDAMVSAAPVQGAPAQQDAPDAVLERAIEFIESVHSGEWDSHENRAQLLADLRAAMKAPQ